MLKQLNYLISFLDKFILTQKDTNTEVPWTAEEIAWKSDRETKFKNPTGDISGFSKPPRWFQNVTNLGIEDKEIGVGVGLVNQDFINWMRVAAFPTFRKLYRKLNHGKNTTFAHGLPAGNYKLTIQYSEFDNQSFIGFLRCYCYKVLKNSMNTFIRLATFKINFGTGLFVGFLIHLKKGDFTKKIFRVKTTFGRQKYIHCYLQ